MIKLKEAERGITNFVPRAKRLGRKLGPILWQLPPKWNVNAERLEEFLSKLPRGIRYAFELRNQSWMTDSVYGILRKYNAAFCIYELAGYQSPIEITARWTYVRLHGPTQHKYQGSYTDAQLRAWSRRIEEWRKTLDAVYVYFDNDDSAHAVTNALTLKRFVAPSIAAPRRSRAVRGSRAASSRSR